MPPFGRADERALIVVMHVIGPADERVTVSLGLATPLVWPMGCCHSQTMRRWTARGVVFRGLLLVTLLIQQAGSCAGTPTGGTLS